MIGNNKMILNNATLQEAVQFWLDSKTVKPLSKVGWIKSNANESEFTVALSAIDAPPATQVVA